MLAFLSIFRHPAVLALGLALTGTAAYLVKVETDNMVLTTSKEKLAEQVAQTQTRLSGLQAQNSALTDSVSQLADEVKLARDATDTLAQTLVEAEKKNVVTTSMLKDIQNAPKTDDGPVAPVLRRVLDGLRDHRGVAATSTPRHH